MVVNELINKNSILTENECRKIVEEIVELKNLESYYNSFTIKNIKGIFAGYDHQNRELFLNLKSIISETKIIMKDNISLLRYFRKYSYYHLINFMIIHDLFHEINHIDQTKKVFSGEPIDINLKESILNAIIYEDAYDKARLKFLFEYDADIHADYDFLTLADKYYKCEEGPLFLYNKELLENLLYYYTKDSSCPKQRQYDYFLKVFNKASEIVISPNMSELEKILHGNQIKRETFYQLLAMRRDKKIKTRNFYNSIEKLR